MKQFLYTYGASVAIHTTAFILITLLATHRHVTPPIEIDFTVSAAHAATEQKAAKAAPTPPVKKNTEPQPQPETVTPPQPASQPSVQAVSAVAVDQTPREPTPPAPQPVTAAAQTKQQSGTTTSTTSSVGDSKGALEQARARYVKEQFVYIRDKIASQVHYPRPARRMGWSGAVQVSFIIEENGSVSDVRIVRSSHHSILDEEAVDTVKRCAPFPRPPVRARIIIPVEFELG